MNCLERGVTEWQYNWVLRISNCQAVIHVHSADQLTNRRMIGEPVVKLGFLRGRLNKTSHVRMQLEGKWLKRAAHNLSNNGR
jgi:hypothetical protein